MTSNAINAGLVVICSVRAANDLCVSTVTEGICQANLPVPGHQETLITYRGPSGQPSCQSPGPQLTPNNALLIEVGLAGFLQGNKTSPALCLSV